MISRKNLHRVVRRTLLRIMLLTGLIVMLTVFYVGTLGIPDRLVTGAVRRINTGDYAFQVRNVTFDLIQGLTLRDVRVYRRRFAGPAVLQAREMGLVVDLLAAVRDRPAVRRLRLSDAVFRPAMLSRPPSSLPQGRPTVAQRPASFDILFELNRCEMEGVTAEQLSGQLSVDGSVWTIRETSGVLVGYEKRRGNVSGRARVDMNTQRVEGFLAVESDPQLFEPWVKAWRMPFLAELAGRFEFGDALPRCEASFERRMPPENTFRLDCRFWMQDLAYRGVSVLRSDGRVSVDLSTTNSRVVVSPLFLVRDEGLIKGGITVDLTRQEVAFDAVSSADPRALVRMIGVLTNGIPDACRFDGPIRISARGMADYVDIANTKFTVDVSGRGMGYGKLVSDECSFKVQVVGLSNFVENVQGRICGGHFRGSGLVAAPAGTSSDAVYRVEGSVEDVELKALVAALAGASEDYRGRVSGSISLGGVLGTNAVSRAHGEGTVAVRDGQIFRLPLFGGLTYYLTRFVPGLNFVVAQSDAKSSFLIGDGKIHTGEVLVEGDVLSLRGRGEYAFDRSLDFKVQVRLLKHKTVAGKIVQFLTSPISKFFEFRLRGTLDKPRWYVRTFSKDLLVQLGLRKKPVPEAVETEEFVPVEALVQEVAP